jgi:hypothetical protein
VAFRLVLADHAGVALVSDAPVGPADGTSGVSVRIAWRQRWRFGSFVGTAKAGDLGRGHEVAIKVSGTQVSLERGQCFVGAHTHTPISLRYLCRPVSCAIALLSFLEL